MKILIEIMLGLFCLALIIGIVMAIIIFADTRKEDK